jgi:ATP/maltotriose-dependent transcriptional regulator MalT
MAYMNMARLAASQGDDIAKREYLDKVKDLLREAPMTFQAGVLLMSMGFDETARGNYETARNFFGESLIIFTRLGTSNFQLIMKSELAHIARHTGDRAQARSAYQETLRGWQHLGNRSAIAHQLECFAFLALADEDPRHATRLLSAAQALRARIDSPRVGHEQDEFDRAMAQLRGMLPDPEFTALCDAGRALTMEQAIHLALGSAPATPG